MMQNGFPKSVRLLRASEFDRVFAARASASDSALVLYGLENDLGHPRLGLAVSRKYGSAVARNRWKRVVREAFRGVQSELPFLDLVCLPRGQCSPELIRIQAGLEVLSRQIEAKLRRHRRESIRQQHLPSDQP
jgi:ribonuclease P protein component